MDYVVCVEWLCGRTIFHDGDMTIFHDGERKFGCIIIILRFSRVPGDCKSLQIWLEIIKYEKT